MSTPTTFSKRTLLKGMLLAPATAVIPAAFADNSHNHHDHHSMTQHRALVKAAVDCLYTGEICLNHCMQLMATGDSSLAKCAQSVQETLAMCKALSELAAQNSSHLVALTKICEKVCIDCERECRKHEDQHAECKACGDSCADCAAECEKIYTSA